MARSSYPFPAPVNRTPGFTLIELMIAVAILALVTSIAIPVYNRYTTESRLGAMRMNLDTLRIAVEAYRLDSRNGDYGSKPFAKYPNAVFAGSFGWTPEGDNSAYSYGLVTQATTFTICAVSDVGASISCRKAGGAYTCTEGTAAALAGACP